MKIFDIVGDKVVINENVLLVPWIKAVKDKYKDYLNALSYCHYRTATDSVYSNLPTEEKERRIQEEFPGDYFVTDKEIADCVNNLLEVRVKYNTIIRNWLATKTMVDKLSDYLMTTEIDDSKEDGNIIYILRIIKDINHTISNFRELEKVMKEETNSRGNSQLGYDQ